MKKLALLFVVAAFAASPAVAASKHKKSKETAEAEEIAKQHDNTRRALRDPAGVADLVAAGLFRHASRRDEERKEKEVKNSSDRKRGAETNVRFLPIAGM